MPYLQRNPVKKRIRPEVRVQERRFLTPKQTEALLQHSRTHLLGPAVWLALLAGLRSESIIALQWDAIDLERSQLLIKQAYKRKVKRVEPFPKGKDWQRVPLVPALRDYLSSLKERTTSVYVAPTQDGRMLSYSTLSRGIKALCKAAGVPEVTTHELRHSSTELFVDVGASIEDLRRLLGHKSGQTTMRYIHRSDERLTNLANSIVLGETTTHDDAPQRLRIVR